jgi:hypothetical protein
MTRAGYCTVIVSVLLIAGFRYAGWSSAILISVLALLWIGLSVGISFVSDKRYARAFNVPVDQPSNGSVDRSRLSIGRAILVGELVVNLPAVGLLVGLILPVGSFVQGAVGYDGTGHAPALPSIVAVAVAFVASWAWWAIAAPRWLLWAMKRVVDPIALRNAVDGSIIWPDNRWGRAFNNTQWRSTAMKRAEQEIVQQFLRRIHQGRA